MTNLETDAQRLNRTLFPKEKKEKSVEKETDAPIKDDTKSAVTDKKDG